jgi:hypothetical protein
MVRYGKQRCLQGEKTNHTYIDSAFGSMGEKFPAAINGFRKTLYRGKMPLQHPITI